jgi:hypothetical protein
MSGPHQKHPPPNSKQTISLFGPVKLDEGVEGATKEHPDKPPRFPWLGNTAPRTPGPTTTSFEPVASSQPRPRQHEDLPSRAWTDSWLSHPHEYIPGISLSVRDQLTDLMVRHVQTLAHTLAPLESSSGPRTRSGMGSATRSDTPLAGVGAWIDTKVAEGEAECAFDVLLLATLS